MLRHFALLLVSAALISSCSSSTPSGPAAASEFVHANVGSTFTFDEYSTDSMNMVVAGSRDTMIATILRTDGNVGAKSGVLIVEEKRTNYTDTIYYAYESDNNLSVSSPSSPTWETVPTGTGTTIIRASEYSLNSGPDTAVIRDSTITSLLGTENVTVKGQLITSKKMQIIYREVSTTNGVKGFDTKIQNILDYAPSLGFEVKAESPSGPNPFVSGGWVDGSIQTLIDYNLK